MLLLRRNLDVHITDYVIAERLHLAPQARKIHQHIFREPSQAYTGFPVGRHRRRGVLGAPFPHKNLLKPKQAQGA